MGTLSENKKAALLSVLLLFVGLFVWEMSIPAQKAVGELTEYELLTGGGQPKAGVPPPSQVLAKAWEQLSNPFYDAGPNDKGIGIQIGYSIYRVLTGYLLAALIAIPLGFLIGMSSVAYKALNPFIQVLRPILIFICSIWPMLINTAFGVAAVREDWVNVARTHELSPTKTAFTVILPAAAPTIVTGMRISIGIAWLVIVAAEMLVGGTGIGYYVWNEWNNLDLTSVIFSILMIGVVGMLLDAAFGLLQRRVTYIE